MRQAPIANGATSVRFKTAFDRYRELGAKKQGLIRDVIRHHWTARQKERLLASGGTRLNGLGADLRRRITGRGERAMRLRQVIAHGAAVEGGDPLFELRPVWMASPETVAQIFPRAAMFDSRDERASADGAMYLNAQRSRARRHLVRRFPLDAPLPAFDIEGLGLLVPVT